MICDWTAGDQVGGYFLLKGANPKVTASGKPFLSAVLADRTGSIDTKVWDYAGPVGPKDEGKVVRIRGSVSEYRGTLQLVADQFSLAGENDPVNLEDLIPTAPIDRQEAWNVIEAAVDSLRDQDYAALCRKMLERHEQALKTIPAGKSVHHAFLQGLLMHTTAMLRTADFLSVQYAGIVDRDLLLTGTLLHDLAKAREFDLSPLGLVTGYSVPGQLLGHSVMGAQEVARLAEELGIPEEKSLLLQHLLLSHHGEPEFGAAVQPLCAEAELLHLIDKIDSRMEIYREALAELEPGEFSGRIFALEKRVYRHQ